MPKQQNIYLGTNTSIAVSDSVILISYVHKTSKPFMHAHYKHTIRFHFFFFSGQAFVPEKLFLD